MSLFDLAVIAVVLLSALFAYFRGFVREALSIAAWINAGVIAAYAIPYVAPLFARFLPEGPLAEGAAAVVVFILALMILHMIAGALAKRVRSSALSPIDRGFGLIFGAARGVIIVCIAYVALSWVLPAGKDRPLWFAESRTAPYLDAGATRMLSYLPLPRGNTSRPMLPGNPMINSAVNAAEREANSAINALSRPAPSTPPAASPAPAYTPDEQRDLNRLIQQQNAR